MTFYDPNTKQNIEFFIPEHFKRIGLNLSGGIDSSILLYLTIDFLEKHQRYDSKIIVLTCATISKGSWNSTVSTEIIKFLVKKTKTSFIDSHITYYRDVKNPKYIANKEYEFFVSNTVDLIITGVTSNPNVGEKTLDKNKNLIDLSVDSIKERDGRQHPLWFNNEVCKWYTPFTNVDKRFIAFLYDTYDLKKDLFYLTRTCENYSKSTEEISAPCGKCWPCLEKNWGFGEF